MATNTLAVLQVVIETQLTGFESALNSIANSLADPNEARRRILAECRRDNINDAQLPNLATAMAGVVMILCLVAQLFRMIPGGDEFADDIEGAVGDGLLDVTDAASDISAFRQVVSDLKQLLAGILLDFTPLGIPASLVVTADLNITSGDPEVDGGILYTARAAGEDGNGIEVQHDANVAAGGHPHALAVAAAGRQITVTLQTNALGNILSTAEEVIDAVNAVPDAQQLVNPQVATDSDGTTGTGAGRSGNTRDDGFEELTGGQDGPTLSVTLGAGQFFCG